MNRVAKSVLVTGGQGFIGRALAKLLRREDYRVVTLDQGIARSADEISCDISDAGQVRRVFEQEEFGMVVHLAAILPTAAQRDPLRATQVNLDGSAHLLEAARVAGVRRFLFGSSLTAYGSYPAERVVTETDRTAPEDMYGAAKVYVEQLGQSYSQRYDLEFSSLRIGRVLGAGSHSTTSAWRSEIFERLRSETPVAIRLPYKASERILVLHVDEAAQIFLALIRAPRLQHSVYNAPCESMTVGELKQMVEALNAMVTVETGDAVADKNPRRLDASRFQKEFDFKAQTIVERLRGARSAAG